MSRTVGKRIPAVLAVAVSASVAAVALAKHQLVSASSGSVKLFRNKVTQTSANLSFSKASFAGGYVSLVNAKIKFECPSSYRLNNRVRVTTPHDYQEKPSRGGRKRRDTFTFSKIKVATQQELISACLDGRATHSVTLRTATSCALSKGFESDVKGRNTNIPVTISLDCKEIIPSDETFASVFVRKYRHDCPPGFVMKSGKRADVTRASQPQKCVRM